MGADFAREMYVRALIQGMVLGILLLVAGGWVGWQICRASAALDAAVELADSAERYVALRPVADSALRRLPILAGCP